MYRKMTLKQINKIYFPKYTSTKLVVALKRKMNVFSFLDYDNGTTYYILSDEQLTQLEKVLKSF